MKPARVCQSSRLPDRRCRLINSNTNALSAFTPMIFFFLFLYLNYFPQSLLTNFSFDHHTVMWARKLDNVNEHCGLSSTGRRRSVIHNRDPHDDRSFLVEKSRIVRLSVLFRAPIFALHMSYQNPHTDSPVLIQQNTNHIYLSNTIATPIKFFRRRISRLASYLSMRRIM